MSSIVGGLRNKNGHKRKHHEVTLKVKYEALKELEKGRANKDVANQFSIPGKKTEEKYLKLFKIHHRNDIVKTGTYEKLNEALLLTSFQSMVPFFWRKLMNLLNAFNYNDFTASNCGCLNGRSSLACIVLYIVKAHPLLIFFKI